MNMAHRVRESPDGLVVALVGDIDLETSPDSRRVLLESVARKVAVVADLSGVDYMDSSGVASLVEALQAAKRNGTAFSLASPQPKVLRVLQLARLDKVFRIVEHADQALSTDG
jgi:anti-sigma B factor antagonist